MANQTEKFSEDSFSILNSCIASNFSDLTIAFDPNLITNKNVLNNNNNNNNNGKAIFCEACNLYLNSRFVYNQHVTGTKHQKKVREFNLNNNNNNPLITDNYQQPNNNENQTNLINTDEIQKICESFNKKNYITSTDSKKEEKIFRCNYCNLDLNSLSSYNQHINGHKHMKKVKEYESLKGQLDQPVHSPSSITIEGIINENNSNLNKITDSFKCDLCDLNLQTKEQLMAHLKGKRHLKKLNGLKVKNEKEQVQIEEASNASSEIETKSLIHQQIWCNNMVVSANESSIKKNLTQNLKFDCEICNISLPNQEQLNSHLSGRKHLNKLQSLSKIPIKEIKKQTKPDEDTKYDHLNIAWSKYEIDPLLKEQTKNIYDFYCNLCKKYIQRKIQLVDHLKSKKHHAKIIAARNKNQNCASSSEDKKQIINKPIFKAKKTFDTNSNRLSKRPVKFVSASNQPMLSANSFNDVNNKFNSSNIQSDYDKNQINLANYGYGFSYNSFNDVYQQAINSYQNYNYQHPNFLTSQQFQYTIDPTQANFPHPNNQNTSYRN